MKKENKKTNNKNIMKMVKISTIILLIVLVSMIGFFGIYKQNKNQVSNVVKDYSYAMDINGARNIKLVLDTDTKEVIKDKDGNVIENATDEEIEKNGYTKETVANNSEDVKTLENYNKSKEIIEKRLKDLDIEEYNISLNSKTGEMILEIPENDKTDTIVSNINTIGKFEITDSESGEVLLNNSNIKSSRVLYNTETSGTSVYLEIVFNKEGKNKLEEISKTYVKKDNNTTSENNTAEENENVENETTENAADEESTGSKQIKMKIDDEEIMATSFDEPITTGKIQLSVGKASTDKKTIQNYVTQAQNMATVLDSGSLPIKYNIEKNQYILSDINQEQLGYIAIAMAVLVVVGIIALIIKYKSKGLLAGIAYIGLAAIYLLLVRYANVVISIESLFGIATILILNFIFTFMLVNKVVKNIKENKGNAVNKASVETYKKFFNRIIPICIMVIAFCFVKWIPISSFGMISFWGLLMIAVYNALITRYLLKVLVEYK